MDNNVMFASVLLDPRNRGLLTDDQKFRATETLRITWRKLQSMQSQENARQAEAVPPPTLSPGDRIIWELKQQRRNSPGYRIKEDFTSQLNNYLATMAVDSTTNLMDFWRVSRQLWPALYELAAVVHACPATQVSVERLFSAMKFILHHLRVCLAGDVLEDILIIRANRAFSKKDDQPSAKKRDKLYSSVILNICKYNFQNKIQKSCDSLSL